MTARPFYLQPTQPARITLDTSVALRVHVSGQSGLRMPFAKLSRVVCNHHVQWESDALVACLQHGIPIAFLDARGRSVGWCFGARRRETTLANLLAHALAADDWTERFAPWLEGQHRARAAQALLLCGIVTSHAHLADVRNVLCNLHRARLGVPAGAVLGKLEALTRCDVAAALADAIGDTALLAWQRPGVNLIDAFAELVAIHAHTIIHSTYELPAADQAARWAAQHYEKHAGLFAQSTGALIGAFELFLREHWL
jgi:hypothetical protein